MEDGSTVTTTNPGGLLKGEERIEKLSPDVG